MKAENYWKQFLSTGKIDDYLAYRRINIPDVEAFGQGGSDGDGGVTKGAGTGQCYRDDFKS